MSRLRGKVALVTGAGGPNSMGGAIALELAKEGADIAASNIEERQDSTEKLAEIVRGEDVRCLVCLGDISRVSDCQRLVDDTINHFGQLDILVNCAGIGLVQDILDITEQDFDQTMDVNLKGTFFVSQAAIRHMLKRGSGRIINIGSELGYKGDSLGSHYTASKAGIRGLQSHWPWRQGRELQSIPWRRDRQTRMHSGAMRSATRRTARNFRYNVL